MKAYKTSAAIIICWIIFIFPNFDVAEATLIKVASIQYRAIPHNKSENIINLANLIEEASTNGAKIIVLPEMCTTGLAIKNKEQAKVLAETVPGLSTDVFANLARKYSVYIILGMPELESQSKKYYNLQIVINPTGLIIAKYRKIHLYGPDYNWAEKGDLGYQVAETLWGKIGLGICSDINFPDMLDFFSEKGVNIFAFSTNWVDENIPFNYWISLLKNRNFYFIAANNWGSEEGLSFSGGSIILSTDLTILSKTDTNANIILYAQIDIRQ